MLPPACSPRDVQHQVQLWRCAHPEHRGCRLQPCPDTALLRGPRGPRHALTWGTALPSGSCPTPQLNLYLFGCRAGGWIFFPPQGGRKRGRGAAAWSVTLNRCQTAQSTLQLLGRGGDRESKQGKKFAQPRYLNYSAGTKATLFCTNWRCRPVLPSALTHGHGRAARSHHRTHGRWAEHRTRTRLALLRAAGWHDGAGWLRGGTDPLCALQTATHADGGPGSPTHHVAAHTKGQRRARRDTVQQFEFSTSLARAHREAEPHTGCPDHAAGGDERSTTSSVPGSHAHSARGPGFEPSSALCPHQRWATPPTAKLGLKEARGCVSATWPCPGTASPKGTEALES